MKIPPPPLNTPPLHRPASGTNKTNSKSGATTDASQTSSATAGDDANALDNEGAHGRDFASVLEDVTRTPERDREERESGDNKRYETAQADRAERERETERREDERGGSNQSGGGFEQRGGVRDMGVRGELTSARAILHIVDLERIVSNVRTQMVAGGRREIVIELQRSVLEGLRVRLSADEAGRISAEFIAASERVRSQLDARTSDLADLLRSRGLNLAALTTSVGTEFNQNNSSDNRHANDALTQTSAPKGTAASFVSSETDSASAPDTDNDSSTYRA
ncbi:MAG TPA: flagellar hook-length control protein FliK [Pyrinomonadaceae bacterium]